MSEERYRCVCHTCESEELVDGLEDAQERFNEHADRSHEVELLNQQTRQQYSNSPPDEDELATDDESTGED